MQNVAISRPLAEALLNLLASVTEDQFHDANLMEPTLEDPEPRAPDDCPSWAQAEAELRTILVATRR